MNPYLLTLAFLMLMSILTSSEVVRFSQGSLGIQLHNDYLDSKVASERALAHAAFEDFRKHNPDAVEEEEKKKKPSTPRKPSAKVRRSTALGFNFTRPPNNSRLNLYLLLHEEPNKDYPLSLYEAAARLMHLLYAEAKFYEPNAEYRILDALIAQKKATALFSCPDELATLELGDPKLQAIFYCMLKGADERPSLLDFITFDKEGLSRDKKKVNLMFADRRLIEALLDNAQITEKLLAARAALWEEIFDQEAHRLERTKEECKGRNDLKRDLANVCRKIFLEAGLDFDTHYKWVFDLGLGHLGNILFIEDPKTGFVRREKYLPIKRY
ncbi:MAG: hypothetical protein JJU12_02760 [Chlamydiales bacterium]|nr:hypothetical protein [Chlamydiales bacterium]